MKNLLVVSMYACAVAAILVAIVATERPIEKRDASLSQAVSTQDNIYGLGPSITATQEDLYKIEDDAMSGDIIDNKMLAVDGGTISSIALIGDGYVTMGGIKPQRWIDIGGVVTIDTYEKRATYTGAPDEAAKKFVEVIDEYISGSWGFSRILRSGSDTIDRAYLLYVGDEYNSEDLSIESLPKNGLTIGGVRVLEWGDSDNPELRTVCDVEKGVAAFRKVLEKYK